MSSTVKVAVLFLLLPLLTMTAFLTLQEMLGAPQGSNSVINLGFKTNLGLKTWIT